MSSRKAVLYVQDLLQACQDISEFTGSMESALELVNDRRTFLAVVRSLEIIGEAARQLPKAFKDDHLEIPWREIAGLRNVIAHEYFGLDADILWDVIRSQIPALFDQLKRIRME
jgi:uncharacterized protein with HEPN domain